MSSHGSQQLSLSDAPRDGITNVEYHPTEQNLLLSSSWDKTVRLHDTTTGQLQNKIDHDTPILDTCFGMGNHLFSAGLDGQINSIDLATGKKLSLGRHSEGARSVCWSSTSNALYSGSWDKSICVWDTRSNGHRISKQTLSQKVYSMDLKHNTLVIAMPHRRLYVYDIRNMDKPWQVRETGLKYMLKTVRLAPDGRSFACSSIEGRASMDFFDHGEGTRKFVFKLHRQRIGDNEVVYPVNSLSFHPIHGTFASGGSDGVVSVWDGINQKRIRQFPKYTEEISNIAFNCDGSQLAIARSYTFDEGERPHEPDAIFIRSIGPNDCKPRPA